MLLRLQVSRLRLPRSSCSICGLPRTTSYGCYLINFGIQQQELEKYLVQYQQRRRYTTTTTKAPDAIHPRRQHRRSRPNVGISFAGCAGDADQALRVWSNYIERRRGNQTPSIATLHELLHILVSNQRQSAVYDVLNQVFSRPLGGRRKNNPTGSVDGIALSKQLMVAGRIVRHGRGRSNAGLPRKRPSSSDALYVPLADQVALSVVQWAEDLTVGSLRHSSDDGGGDIAYLDALMYLYCQAGYAEDAFVLWRRRSATVQGASPGNGHSEEESHAVWHPDKMAMSGLLKLLYQQVGMDIVRTGNLRLLSAADTPSSSGGFHIDAVISILKTLRFMRDRPQTNESLNGIATSALCLFEDGEEEEDDGDGSDRDARWDVVDRDLNEFLPGPIAKGFHGCVTAMTEAAVNNRRLGKLDGGRTRDDDNGDEEGVEEESKSLEHDEAAGLEAALQLASVMRSVGVEPLRRTWTELLRFSCCSLGYSQPAPSAPPADASALPALAAAVAGKGATTVEIGACHALQRAYHIFGELENAATSSVTVNRGRLRQHQRHDSAQGKNAGAMAPTRYEFSLLVAALEALEQWEGQQSEESIKDEKGRNIHGDRIEQTVERMKAAGLLPLSDGGIIRRAESTTDLASLKGSLAIRRKVGPPLDARLVTTLMRILVDLHDKEVEQRQQLERKEVPHLGERPKSANGGQDEVQLGEDGGQRGAQAGQGIESSTAGDGGISLMDRWFSPSPKPHPLDAFMFRNIAVASPSLLESKGHTATASSHRFVHFAWALWSDFARVASRNECKVDQGMIKSGKNKQKLQHPDLTMFNVALLVASRLPNAPALLDATFAELAAVASNGSEGHRVLLPDIYTFNVLVAGYAQWGDVSRCKRIVFEEMPRAGIEPDVVTFNSLIKACISPRPFLRAGLEGESRGEGVKSGADLDEALVMLDAAITRGIKPDHVTFRSLCHAFGHSNAMVEAIQAMERTALPAAPPTDGLSLSHSSSAPPFTSTSLVLDEGAESTEHALEARLRGEFSSSFSSSSLDRRDIPIWRYEVDLHSLGVSEAKARITRELDTIHEVSWRVLRSTRQEEEKEEDIYSGGRNSLRPITFGQEKGDSNGKSTDTSISAVSIAGEEFSDFQNLRLPEVVLITGVGKHSSRRGVSIVREAIISVLNEKGISYAEPAGNAGRIIIAPKELEAFLMRHDSEQIWTSLSQHISFRYVMVPSLLASILVVPKLLDFYSSFPQ